MSKAAVGNHCILLLIYCASESSRIALRVAIKLLRFHFVAIIFMVTIHFDLTGYPGSELRLAMTHRKLQSDTGRFSWKWMISGVPLDRVIWPVVESAAEMLTTGDLSRLRQCMAKIADGFLKTRAAIAAACGAI